LLAKIKVQVERNTIKKSLVLKRSNSVFIWFDLIKIIVLIESDLSGIWIVIIGGFHRKWMAIVI